MRNAIDESCDVAVGATCIALLALTLFVGCSPDVVGVSGDEHDHEAEHHVPHHFPCNAVGGIERLQELLTPTPAERPAPTSKSEVTPRQEVYDLARWLPELAAETELGEPSWNKVRDASRALERAAEATTGDAAPAGTEVATAMQVLSRIPQAILDAEVAYRQERGLEAPRELAIDASTEETPSTTGPES